MFDNRSSCHWTVFRVWICQSWFGTHSSLKLRVSNTTERLQAKYFLDEISPAQTNTTQRPDARTVNSTPHLARITRAIFSRAWLKRTSCIFSVLLTPKDSHCLARMSCFAPYLIHLYLLRSALRPLPLCFSLRTGQTPAPRQQDSCLAVLPNSLCSWAMSPKLRPK